MFMKIGGVLYTTMNGHLLYSVLIVLVVLQYKNPNLGIVFCVWLIY